MPYVKGAAVLVFSFGMPMALYTKLIKSKLYKRPQNLSNSEYPSAELLSGSAYCWAAGEEGCADWLVKHSVWPHPKGWAGGKRYAIILCATEEEHARPYATQRWPYTMLEPGEVERRLAAGEHPLS